MTTNQDEKFPHNFDAWWKATQQTFLEKFCQNTCNETNIKAKFHFSHYMSKAIVIKVYMRQQKTHNISAMNISAKFQLYPQFNF